LVFLYLAEDACEEAREAVEQTATAKELALEEVLQCQAV
jgi:hypothetical protein